MRLKSLLQPTLMLLGAGALTVTGVLSMGHTAAVPAEAEGIVWVYYTSVCARPGDASDCKEVVSPARRSFENLEACSAFRDKDLAEAGNPRLLGSCLKQREA